jgi:hypothetical protein
MQWIAGGTFQMGADRSYPEEAPVHTVAVSGFWMDAHTVTWQGSFHHPAGDAMDTDFIQLARRMLPGRQDVLGVRRQHVLHRRWQILVSAVWRGRPPRQAATADAGGQIRSLTHVKAMTIEPVHQPLWL